MRDSPKANRTGKRPGEIVQETSHGVKVNSGKTGSQIKEFWDLRSATKSWAILSGELGSGLVLLTNRKDYEHFICRIVF